MRGQQHERGAAVVEFALIVPILLMLVLGIAEFGRAYYLQTTISMAARDGVRVMAVQNNQPAARAAAKTAAQGLSPALTDGQISVIPTSCAATGVTPPGTATVTVSYPMDFITGFFGADITLTGKGTMRCNG